MFDINGWEVMILAVIGIIILGPERLPAYAARLAGYVRQARSMAEGAKVQLRDQLGPEFDDVNWRQFDPRQYDPRRIVREALAEPWSAPEEPSAAAPAAAAYDPSRPTPWDHDAT